MAPPKPQIISPAAASEPSEPSEVRPGDKDKKQLAEEQEENPQVVAHRPSRQEADREGHPGRQEYDAGSKERFAPRAKSKL